MALCTTGSVDIAIDPNSVEVADATGFAIGNTISFANAIGAGMDLVTTIAGISGTTITLTGSASATVENEQFCLVGGASTWFGPDGPCRCECAESCCCAPNTWDWSAVVDLVNGNSQCNGLDGTYNHPAESFTSVGECQWVSVFDTGIEWDPGLSQPLTPVYSHLRVQVFMVGEVCTLLFTYTLYIYNIAAVANRLFESAYTSRACAQPSAEVSNSWFDTPCDISSTVTITAT